MIQLTPRLKACASMITGKTVCDIGTDHAYLPAWLILKEKADRVIATDVREGPLRSAKETLRRFDVSDRIELLLSDGFDDVRPDGITDVVIAGMGGETIRDILTAESASFLKEGINLVLQPMSKAELLRKWLAGNGYAVTREIPVKETKIYSIMQVHYNGIFHEISAAESYIGKLNPADPMTHAYAENILKRLSNRAKGLEKNNSIREADKVRQLINEITLRLQYGGTI